MSIYSLEIELEKHREGEEFFRERKKASYLYRSKSMK